MPIEVPKGRLKIHLQNFQVVKKRDRVGKDEPYLWVFGIRIALGGESNDFNWVVKMPPEPGNLGGPMDKGDSRAIPASVGLIERDLNALFAKGIYAGVVVVAWDHDRTPAVTMRLGYDDCAQHLENFIQARVTAFNDAPLTQAEEDALAEEMRELVKTRIGQTLQIGTLNFDDKIDTAKWFGQIQDAKSPFRQPLNFVFDRIGAEYRVTGEITWTPAPEKRSSASGPTGG